MTQVETDPEIEITGLTPEAEVALLARMLHREGYNDHTAGHITYRQDDGTLLTNPFPLTWDEVRASDVVRIDADGNRLSGRYQPSPAIALHVELHRARPDVRVAVHHHPEWASVWAAAGEVPPIYDQTSAMVAGDLVLFDEYERDVTDVDAARRNVEALADHPAAILRNHGVFVVAPSIEIAHLRAVSVEWRCRLAWRVRALGVEGRPMEPGAVENMARRSESGDRATWPWYYEAGIRRELRHDPRVLD
jgi:ribulose-5-phosphate 4-epimerase/fuculose-1-phosphate aldolase